MKEDREIGIRIVLERPPAGAHCAVQRGRVALIPPVRAVADEIAFELRIGVVTKPDGAIDFRGEVVQGKRGERFVYVNSGSYGAQADTVWNRRAKVHLSGITSELLASLDGRAGAVLQARIAGTAKDGGPAAASVPLLGGGWTVADA